MRSITGGLWPALFTPFTETGSPNLAAIQPLVEVMVREGLDGLYVLGSTGQGPALSVAERKQVAAGVIEAAAGRLPVMVHVGSNSTRDSVDLARHAADAGADAISSVPPIYYAASADGVFEHYRQIGAASELPFYVYHHAMFGEGALAAPDYPQRLLSIPNVAGMKVTIRDLYIFGVLNRATEERLTLFSGADELLCHAAVSGASGAIGTTYNLWGPVCKATRAAFVGGDFEQGKSFMATFQSRISKILQSENAYKFFRTAMQLKYEIDIGPGLAPSCYSPKEWDESEVRTIIREVDEAGALTSSSS